MYGLWCIMIDLVFLDGVRSTHVYSELDGQVRPDTSQKPTTDNWKHLNEGTKVWRKYRMKGKEQSKTHEGARQVLERFKARFVNHCDPTEQPEPLADRVTRVTARKDPDHVRFWGRRQLPVPIIMDKPNRTTVISQSEHRKRRAWDDSMQRSL